MGLFKAKKAPTAPTPSGSQVYEGDFLRQNQYFDPNANAMITRYNMTPQEQEAQRSAQQQIVQLTGGVTNLLNPSQADIQQYALPQLNAAQDSYNQAMADYQRMVAGSGLRSTGQDNYFAKQVADRDARLRSEILATTRFQLPQQQLQNYQSAYNLLSGAEGQGDAMQQYYGNLAGNLANQTTNARLQGTQLNQAAAQNDYNNSWLKFYKDLQLTKAQAAAQTAKAVAGP